MSDYHVHVLTAHPHMAFQVEHKTLRSARSTLKTMTEWMQNEFGEFVDEYSFEDRDTLLITGPDGKVVDAWQRHETLDIAYFAKISRDTMPDDFHGWQIVNSDGYNIHGDADDPFNLSSYSILCYGAQDIAREWVEENPGYAVVPVLSGDIEEPEFIVGDVMPSPALTI